MYLQLLGDLVQRTQSSYLRDEDEGGDKGSVSQVGTAQLKVAIAMLKCIISGRESMVKLTRGFRHSLQAQ